MSKANDKIKWLLLVLSIFPLLLCLSFIENIIVSDNVTSIHQKNSLFSTGVLSFLFFITASVIAYMCEKKTVLNGYFHTIDGKIHLLSFLLCAVTLTDFYFGLQFMGDDTAYKAMFESRTIAGFIPEFYRTTSPTIIIHAIIFSFIVKSTWYWRIFNVLIILFGAECAINIAIPKNKRKYSIIVYLLFYLIPQAMYNDAGWCATALNYVWPISITFFIILLLKREIENRSSNLYLKALSILCLPFACNSIQCSTCIFPLTCLVIGYLIYIRGSIKDTFSVLKSHPYLCIVCGLSFICLLSNSICPGNAERFGWSVTMYYPTFLELTLIDKIELGFINEMANIYGPSAGSHIVLPLMLTLLFLLWSKKGENKQLLVATTILALIIFVTNKIRAISYFETSLIDILENKEINPQSLSKSLVNFECCFYIFMIGVIFYAIIKNIKDIKDSIFIILLLIAGISSGVLMGFSPTIYASGLRTLLLSTICTLFATIVLFFTFIKDYKCNDIKCLTLIAISIICIKIGGIGPILEQPVKVNFEQVPALPEKYVDASTPIKSVHVDIINNNMQADLNNFSAENGRNISIIGWAFDIETKSQLKDLYLLIGDKAIKTAYGSERQDVQQAFGLTTANVGFQIVIPSRLLETKKDSKDKELKFVQIGTNGDYKFMPITYTLSLK